MSTHPGSQATGSTPASGRRKRRTTEEKLPSDRLEEGTDRQIRAARPRPGAEPMRVAYLELLKLCLCDLAGARTLSVSRTGDTRRPDSQVKCRELDDEELALRAMGSDWPFSGLTMVGLVLDKAVDHEDLEALVLLQEDVEIVDRDFAPKVREALSDPDVAIVGCAGAVGVRSIAWWQGALTWAGLTHRYQEYGGGDFPAISWRPETVPSYASTGEVDSIDGFVMVLSPWAVRELRFDESLGKLHGYDFDICMQARAAGKKVVTADFRAIHHHSLELINDPETGSRPTSGWRRSGTASFPTRAPTPDRALCAPRPRQRPRGRSWSPTRCASGRSSASSPAWSESSTGPGSSLRPQGRSSRR